MSFEPVAYQLGWARRLAPAGPFEPEGDPLGAGYMNRRMLQQDHSRLVRGVVVDAIAYAHCYRVNFEFLQAPLPCVLGSPCPSLPLGPRALNTLQPGVVVWVAWKVGSDHGVILAVEPAPTLDPSALPSDWIAMSSRCGIAVDAAHQAVFRADNFGGMVNWSAGRPRDSTTAGEWGVIYETGVRIAADSFLAQLAVDEATGFFAFYHDQLCRITGVNIQEWSAGHVRESGDDEGEVAGYHGWTPYPWEQLGTLRPGLDATREVPDRASQVDTPYLASREPRHDDQVPFHRRVAIGGYPGQAGKDLVLLPPGQDFARLSDPPKPPADATAVLEEQRTLAGGYLLRAAKGIHITKQATIVAPRRLKRAEDRSGDTPGDYRPAGDGEHGPEHRVTADIRVTAAADQPGQKAAGFLDELARVRNWEGEHALQYHAKDWRVPEESETQAAGPTRPVPVADLSGQDTLDAPDPVPLAVDHRYGEVDYIPNEAGFHILDDGTVVIRDGWGSTIVMTGGKIYADAPGDVVVRPGRSLVAWAGRDVSLRANQCWEAAAGTGDLRLKSERNLHVLAGNAGKGGLLLESRGEDAYRYKGKLGTDVVSGGIQLKSAGAFVSWAEDHYIRSRDQGMILLDADKGAGTIYSWSAHAYRYLTEDAADYFGTPTDVQATNTFAQGATMLNGGLEVLGDSSVAGGLLLGGDLNIVGGYLYSDQSDSQGGSVGGLPGGAGRQFQAQLSGTGKGQRAANKAGEDAYRTILQPDWYADGQAGDDKLIEVAGFSFRTTKQYKAEDLTCWEAIWQQQARLAGIELGTWTEPPVELGSAKTYPYPGQARWADDKAYLHQDLTLFDAEAGVAKDRGKNRAKYEDPEYAKPEPVTLDGNYPIIDQA